MIRGTTAQPTTQLYYRERIEAWLWCEKAIRSDVLGEAAIALRLGHEEQQGRVQLHSMHPTEPMVHCVIVGEMLGGPQHGWLVVDFSPMQDERFRVVAPEKYLDAICAKTEIRQAPICTAPNLEPIR